MKDAELTEAEYRKETVEEDKKRSVAGGTVDGREETKRKDVVEKTMN